MSDFNFLPSVLHQHIIDSMEQKLTYKSGDVQQWQATLRPKLKQLLGDIPTEKCPFNVRSLWKRNHELGTIEKIIFTAEHFCDVPAYLCLPKITSLKKTCPK